MSLSVLDIKRGADELREPFDKRLSELNVFEQELLKDEKVQLYLFLHQEIARTEEKRNEKIADYLSNVRIQCEHPLYICVTSGSYDTYSYKCICLNCGTSRHFKQYELDKLYDEHKVIAKRLDEDNSLERGHYHHYSCICTVNEAMNYYSECYQHLQNVTEKVHGNDLDSSVELSASEMTYNHFVHPEKNLKKVIKKKL